MAEAATAPVATPIGEVVERLDLDDVWLVDPTSGREGIARLRIEDGRVAAFEWSSAGGKPADQLVMPGLTDLHVHARQPGDEDAETVATAMAAAAHGGFTRICLMPNTRPPIDSAAAVGQLRELATATGLPIRVEVVGTTTLGRAGAALAPMGELADAGAVAFTDDGAPVADAALMRHALTYAGALGRPVIEHAEDRTLTDGAEMHDGVVATILGPARLAGRRRGSGCRAGDRHPRRRQPGSAGRRGTAAASDPPLDGRGARRRPCRQGPRAGRDMRRHATPPRAPRRLGGR